MGLELFTKWKLCGGVLFFWKNNFFSLFQQNNIAVRSLDTCTKVIVWKLKKEKVDGEYDKKRKGEKRRRLIEETLLVLIGITDL